VVDARHDPYLPASNNKLVTAVTALTTMGASRRLATSVRLAPLPRSPRPTPSPTPTSPSPATTSPSPATTSATPTTTSPSPTTTTPTPTPTPTPAPVRTVHLVAGGDPLLTSANLRGLAETTATALKAKGSRTARVALDDTLFPSPTNGPGWRSGYVPDVVRPVRALVRDGTSSGTSPRTPPATSPPASGRRHRRDVRRPVEGLDGAPTIASYAGHTIGAAVTAMMLPSDNHIAEMLFRLSALATGRAATWAGASASARSVLTSLQVPLAGVVLADGSGVSRADRLTPAALTTLLLRVADSTRYPKLRTRYNGQGMPVAGRTGPLSNRYRVAPSSCARGKVLAKTGTLHDVVALSGITPGADGRLKVFSVLVNAVPDSADKTLVRRAVDNLAATVTGCW
jgi:D-alanyl-D-alanine carboxypeptidase/D-alanyl-D-alanine-endopeptidase (penicillin-binding protein 4)